MNFEEAARQHKRLERIQSVLSLRGDLVCDIDRLYGVAVAPCLAADSVLLWFVCQGAWQAPVRFPLTSLVSLDHRLRELVAAIQPVTPPLSQRSRSIWRCLRAGTIRAGATASGSEFQRWIKRRIGSWCGRFRA